MICDFNVPYSQVTLGARAELAATHLFSIPERIYNTITQLFKLVLCALGAALTLGQSNLLNAGFMLAGKKVVLNAVGAGISLVGVFAPLTAADWQQDLYHKLEMRGSTKATNFAFKLNR